MPTQRMLRQLPAAPDNLSPRCDSMFFDQSAHLICRALDPSAPGCCTSPYAEQPVHGCSTPVASYSAKRAVLNHSQFCLLPTHAPTPPAVASQDKGDLSAAAAAALAQRNAAGPTGQHSAPSAFQLVGGSSSSRAAAAARAAAERQQRQLQLASVPRAVDVMGLVSQQQLNQPQSSGPASQADDAAPGGFCTKLLLAFRGLLVSVYAVHHVRYSAVFCGA